MFFLWLLPSLEVALSYDHTNQDNSVILAATCVQPMAEHNIYLAAPWLLHFSELCTWPMTNLNKLMDIIVI